MCLRTPERPCVVWVTPILFAETRPRVHGEIATFIPAGGFATLGSIRTIPTRAVIRFMARLLALFLGFLSVCAPLQAEAPPVVARVVPELSLVEERWIGGTVLRLGLDAGVPYRVFNLNDPPRLVMDFRNVAFDGLTPTDMLSKPGRITALQFGSFAPGWSRLVAELSGPFPAEDVEMKIDPQTGQALLEVRLGPESQETFDTVVSRNRPDPWETEQAPQSIPPAAHEERFVVVIDPGHGGIDPGAISGDKKT
jgi:N-acetylmuramoyl-L-alanine amidase